MERRAGEYAPFWAELYVEKKYAALPMHLQHVVAVDGHDWERAWPRGLLRAASLVDDGHHGPVDHLRGERWAAGAEAARVPTGRATAPICVGGSKFFLAARGYTSIPALRNKGTRARNK